MRRSARPAILLLALVACAGLSSSVWADTPLTPLRLDRNGQADLLLYTPTTGYWFVVAANRAAPDGFDYASGVWQPGFSINPGRFNSDGLVDIFLYSQTTGEYGWAVNSGGGFTFQQAAGLWSPGWEIHIADFNADGLHDVFLYNPSSGLWLICLSTGTHEFRYFSGTLPAGRTIITGDFNGDARADVFSYDNVTGDWTESLTTTDGTGFASSRTGTWSAGWQVVPVNLNNDGRTDLFLYNAGTGIAYRCLSTNTAAAFTYQRESWSPDWTIYPADFNGDGISDILLYNSATGVWFQCVTQPGGLAFTYYRGQWSPGWQVNVTDYDGDLRSDIFLYAPGSGTYYRAVTIGPGQFQYAQGQWSPGWQIISEVDRGNPLLALAPPPVVSSMTPASGSVTGGTAITIKGANFELGAVVSIGGNAATGVTLSSATTLSAVTPTHAVGTADVVVTNPDGQRGTLANGFTYIPTAPYLTTPNILCFGDSITAGTGSSGGAGGPTAYPARLLNLLHVQYPKQTLTVMNDGLPGEYAVNAATTPDPTGAGRFATDVWGDKPDLVLLLEGVNDTNLPRSPSAIANDLGRMVRTAKNSNVKVILATLTPVVPGNPKGDDPATIAAVNVQIRAVAASEAVPLVDFEAAFASNWSLFNPDGLHPNDAGYALMAQTFFSKIVSTFQILK